MRRPRLLTNQASSGSPTYKARETDKHLEMLGRVANPTNSERQIWIVEGAAAESSPQGAGIETRAAH